MTMLPYISHRGVDVYRVFKEDGEGITRTFQYSLDNDGDEFGDRVFDVRDLPTYAGRQDVARPPLYPYPTGRECAAIESAIVGALEAGLRLDDYTHGAETARRRAAAR